MVLLYYRVRPCKSKAAGSIDWYLWCKGKKKGRVRLQLHAYVVYVPDSDAGTIS